MRAARSDRYPAYAASAALHLLVLLAGVVAWPSMNPPTRLRAVTPVTLVTQSEASDLRAADQAPEVQAAATETPDPEAPAQLATPTPVPAPVSTPKPSAAPAPVARPLPKPVPPKPAPAKPTPSFNLDALAASVSKSNPRKTQAKAAPAAPGLDLDALAASVGKSSAQKGAARAQTDLTARAAVGAGRASTLDLQQAIGAKLGRLWNPNCGVEGSANITVKVRLNLAPDGRLIRADLLDEQRINGSGDPVLRAAATRALTAVARAAPYDELPSADFSKWRAFVVAFDARQICRGY